MTTITHTALGYPATRTADALTIHRVPIFCACSRGDHEFDDVWIRKAVDFAMQRQRDGYAPPLHLRHHEPSTDMNDSVKAAGYFRIVAAAPITLKGTRKSAIFADLIITDPATQDDVIAHRWPYRSVEIFDVDVPKIDGLALLDHEAPFLELPMLMVNGITETDAGAPGTFKHPWKMDASQTGNPVVACFRRGAHAHLLFKEDPSMAATAEPKTEPEFGAGVETPPPAKFADDGPPKKDDDDKDDENAQGDTLDVSAVVKAIESGEISIADMDAILAAIQSQGQEKEPEAEEPAPAAAPGTEAMKQGQMSMQFAAMQGKLDAQEARLDGMNAEATRKDEVGQALQRLEGRPLGADLESKLVAFHTAHGADAFKAYVDSLAETFGTLPGTDGTATAFMGQHGKTPEVAMKYHDQGVGAVDKAAKHAREWEQLNAAGMQTTQENYVKRAMAAEEN